MFSETVTQEVQSLFHVIVLQLCESISHALSKKILSQVTLNQFLPYQMKLFLRLHGHLLLSFTNNLSETDIPRTKHSTQDVV